MSHVVDNRKKLLARVNRLIGQMTALKKDIERAETDEECSSIMQQLSSIRGAIRRHLGIAVRPVLEPPPW